MWNTRYFTFVGHSCLDILDTPLILATFNDVNEIDGSYRNMVQGDTSVYRYLANEYGTVYEDTLRFSYGLMKSNGEVITPSEQRIIEEWLTSPRLSQYLQLWDVGCDGSEISSVASGAEPMAIYCGYFSSTSWMPYEDGYMGLQFEFTCNSPYAWQFHEQTVDLSNESAEIIGYTDDGEYFIYPKITLSVIDTNTELTEYTETFTGDGDTVFVVEHTIDSIVSVTVDGTALSSEDYSFVGAVVVLNEAPQEGQSVEVVYNGAAGDQFWQGTLNLSNNSDPADHHTMSIITQRGKTITIDCQSCMITDNAGDIVDYEDLGWNDVGNIYWLRLLKGTNLIEATVPENSSLKLTISYISPKKIVGGWL